MFCIKKIDDGKIRTRGGGGRCVQIEDNETRLEKRFKCEDDKPCEMEKPAGHIFEADGLEAKVNTAGPIV